MRKWLFLALALCSFVPGQIWAATLYTNYGAGFPGDSAGFYTTGGTFFGTTFTTTSAGNLANISIDVDGTTSPVTVGLYTNVSGEPGTLLESWTATIPTNTFSPALTTLTSLLNPSLASGTQYWLVLTESANQIDWYQNDLGVLGGVWVGGSIGALGQVFSGVAAPGIQLTSTSTTPEPTSAALLGGGLLALLALRRKTAVR